MFPPLALRVRTYQTAAIRTLVPLNSKPSQIFHHCVHKFRAAALRIQVFIAENQLTAILGGTLSGRPKRARVAKVKQPCRRRRKPPTVGSR